MALETNKIYEFGSFRLDPLRRVLSRGDGLVPLTAKALETLLALVMNRNRVMVKDELMKIVWPDSFVEEVNLAQNISALRRIFGETPGENRYIATVPGRGYRWVAEVREISARPEDSSEVDHTPDPPAATPKTRNRSKWLVASLSVLAAAAGSIYIFGTAVKLPGSVSRRPHSLAVLPFRPLGESDTEHLGIGMTDAVITKLSNIHDLVIRPTSAVLRYAGLPLEPAKVGRELAAEALLEGKVQKSGERVRVTVQLIRVADSQPLWADTFDENFTSIFAIEDSISEKVAEALAVRFGGGERTELHRHYTANMEAYRDYIEGRYFEFQFTADGLNHAIESFNRATQLDPGYALAYAGLADAYTTASDWILPPRQALPKAETAARRALLFDDRLAEGHAALAHALLHEWKLDVARVEFQRALRLSPNNTSFYFSYGEFLADSGQEDQAVEELNKAIRLDPLSPEINGLLAWPLYLKRDYDGVIAACLKTISLDPDFWVAHSWAGIGYLMKGQFPQSISELQKARALNPDSTSNIAALAAAFALCSRRADAEKLLADLNTRRSRQYVSPMDLATVHHALHRNDEVFRCLDEAYQDRSEMLLVLDRDPAYDDLHGDPRFREIVRRVQRVQREAKP